MLERPLSHYWTSPLIIMFYLPTKLHRLDIPRWSDRWKWHDFQRKFIDLRPLILILHPSCSAEIFLSLCWTCLPNYLTVAHSHTPVTLEAEWTRMPSEWKFVVHSWIFEVHSRNSECIPNIRAHSCDRPECFYHAKNIRGAFEVKKYRTAFELHSDCILNILPGR